MNVYSKLALFAGGALFGSAGIKLLSSKDAKNVYTHAAAAARNGCLLSAKSFDNTQFGVVTFSFGFSDIYLLMLLIVVTSLYQLKRV